MEIYHLNVERANGEQKNEGSEYFSDFFPHLLKLEGSLWELCQCLGKLVFIGHHQGDHRETGNDSI